MRRPLPILAVRRLIPALLLVLVSAALVAGLSACERARRMPEGRPTAPVVIGTNLQARSRQPSPEAVACGVCHKEAFALWQGSQHARANRLLSETEDGPLFTNGSRLVHGSYTTSFFRADGDFLVRVEGPGTNRAVHRAEAVIGIAPLYQYLLAFPGGRLQALDVAYDPRSNDWFNVFGQEDRQPREWGHWSNRGMTWNVQCAFCHMTGLQKNYEPATDSYHTSWNEMGISCAPCHGDLSAHTALPDDPRLVPTVSSNLMMQACASCHARREDLTGAFVFGDSFDDHYRLTLPDTPGIFQPDGQVLDEDFEYASFRMSRMGHKGINCLDCHDPHSGKLKLPVENSLLCISCHIPPGLRGAVPVDPVGHSHHPPGVPGSACVDCHMPHNTYMARDARRDHGFTSPDPVLTKELGVPNACNRCHVDQTVDWAIGFTDTWYGERMNRRSRDRARVIARAHAGAEGVATQLLALARSEEIAAWRATLDALLVPAAADPAVQAWLVGELAHESPLVRAAAVRSLSAVPGTYDLLKPLRRDPVRLVRLDATRATLNPVEREEPSYSEFRRYLDFNSDQPGGLMQQAQRALAEGRTDEAETWVRKALGWEESGYALAGLANILYRRGAHAEAEAAFRRAMVVETNSPSHPYELALLLAEQQRVPEATAALEQAVRIEPRFSRAWYNLGLAYAGQERLDLAAQALTRASDLTPDSPEAPYALATVEARRGQKAAALAAAARALAIDPSYAPAVQLLHQLSP